ncbi:MAG: hypothetical protein CME06_06990 [Gemmatimonadetes bacterium]|nr:hypothetical protein [Gemmatimonadota bacterium]
MTGRPSIGGAKRWGAILVLVLSATSLRETGAQLISDLRLESEEDINDAFFEGELDEQTRDELIELLRDPVDINGDDLSRLLVVPGFTPHDLSALERHREKNEGFASTAELAEVPGIDPDQLFVFTFTRAAVPERPVADATPTTQGRMLPSVDLDGWIKIQTARDLHEEGDLRNDLSGDIRSPAGAGRFRVRFRARSEEDEQPGLEERSVYYDAKQGMIERLVFGTVREKLGLGVTLGRRVALTASLRTPDEGGSTLLVPRLGRYNGVFASLRAGAFSPVVLVSENRYALVTDRVLAASLGREGERHSIGAIGARQSLIGEASGDAFERDFLALFGATRAGLVEISGESSWSPGHGLGSELRVESRGAVFESGATLWHYGTDYVNLHSGGTADTDRSSFDVLPDDDIEIRDRQAGERGALIETEIEIVGDWTAEGSFARWANAIDGETDRRADATLAWRRSTRRRAFLRHIWDIDDTQGEASERRTLTFDGRSDAGPYTDLRFRAVWRTRTTSSGDVDSGEIWVESSFRRLAPVSPWLRFRWKDNNFDEANDSYVELQVEERLKFLDRYSLEARARSRFYSDDDRDVNPDAEARVALRISL